MSTYIKDIARMAGVSAATVSRVLNAPELVSPETRKKILEMMKEHGYRYNRLAGGLVSGRTHTLALITPGEDNFFDAYYFKEIFTGMNSAASKRGYNILVDQMARFDPSSNAANFPVDGNILVSPAKDDPIIHTAQDSGIPCVLVNCRSDIMNWVDSDNVNAARDIVKYIADMGHTEILALTGPPNVRNSIDRMSGFRDAMRAAAIEVKKQYVLDAGFSEEIAYSVISEFIKGGCPVTAIIAFNDLMAIGAIRALKEAGIKVPDNVSVTGFDDIEISRYFSPAITTVKQPLFDIGSYAANLLVDRVEGAAEYPPDRELTCEIVIRESASLPAGHNKN